MKRRIVMASALAVLALGSAGPASAHFVVVTPPGNGEGTRRHVGQEALAGHHSCFGHMTAAASEQSPAVTFLGPPACPR